MRCFQIWFYVLQRHFLNVPQTFWKVLEENSENTLDKIKEKSFGIHTVIYDNINNHLTCDCATYHKTAFCCSHIYAVQNYVIKDLDTPI